MDEEDGEIPAFACCSAGIGRWFWVAWSSEADARALAPAIASGFEKSADHAEQKAFERLGDGAKRLPNKWASGHRRGGGTASRAKGNDPGPDGPEVRPKSRFGRPKASPKPDDPGQRPSFLYAATAKEPPDSEGFVRVTRHRIAKQNAGKIHVEAEPFDEEEWARRGDREAGSPDLGPAPRTLAVDRLALRKEGRFHVRRRYVDLTFYPSEEAGIRDVEAALTAKYDWCAVLGVRFPCSVESIKASYRKSARASHPDRGGDPAEFRKVEQAYREALAYFAKIEDEAAS